ncbi:MAG: PEP-CTERM sorting domain-containing protein [Bythopirellula sp.]
MSNKHFSHLATAFFAVIAIGVATTHATIITLEPNNSSQSVNLADLVSGQVMGVQVGDKTFTEFFYANLPGDDMPAAEEINIFGFQDENDNFGISIHGTFVDFPDAADTPSDALLRFTVEVSPEAAERGYRISDAHLFVGGIGLGDDSFFSVDESFQQNNQTMSAFATTLNGPREQKLSDWVFFDQLYERLRVTKDIFAFAGDTNQVARTTVIDQSFSQEIIPEPATLGLFMIGLLSIAASKRQD